MIKDLVRLISILIIILFFSYFVYPTRYYYAKFGSDTSNSVLRIDRFTGESEYLYGGKWNKAADNFNLK